MSASLIADVIHRVAETQRPNLPRQRDCAVPESEIEALCDALMGHDPDAAARLVRQADAEGVSPDSLYLDYIGTAARRMGERWLADCASFLEVSLAGGRLMTIIRDLGLRFGGPEAEPLPGHSIVVSTVPGETHALGAAIAAEYFRRSRWQVTLLDGADWNGIAEALVRERPAVLGLSAGSRRMVPVLAETVRAARRAHPDMIIVVGGPILALEPEIIRTVGADYGAEDPAMLSVKLRRHISVTTLGTGAGNAYP
ncbi:MAG: cobalamin B12-binding domain-containing protein [Pseudomonadota bacterium]